MLKDLFKFQNDNKIILTYFFEGNKIIVSKTNFTNLNVARSYSSIEELKIDILMLKESIEKINENENVHSMFGEIQPYISEEIIPAQNVINFPKRTNFIKESNKFEMDRALLCINNIHRPHTDQNPKYIELHKDGRKSFNNPEIIE